MNKLLGRLKDFLYATTDYWIVLLVIVVASGIITWRLDSLFDKNSNRVKSNSKEITQSIHKPKTESSKSVKTKK